MKKFIFILCLLVLATGVIYGQDLVEVITYITSCGIAVPVGVPEDATFFEVMDHLGEINDILC